MLRERSRSWKTNDFKHLEETLYTYWPTNCPRPRNTVSVGGDGIGWLVVSLRRSSTDGDGSPLVPEADPRRSGCEHDIVTRVYTLGLAERLLDWNRHDVRRLQRHHLSPLLLVDRPDRRPSEPR